MKSMGIKPELTTVNLEKVPVPMQHERGIDWMIHETPLPPKTSVRRYDCSFLVGGKPGSKEWVAPIW
jgi:hypothetical protein